MQPFEDAKDRFVMTLRNSNAVIANVENRRRRDGERRRRGDGATGRRGEFLSYFLLLRLSASLSSCPPVTPSARRPVAPPLFPADLDPLQRFVVVLDRIDDQVVEDFADARVAGSNYGQPARAANLRAAFLQPRRDHLQRFVDDLIK